MRDQMLIADSVGRYWPTPRHRDFAAIGGDTSVYQEVLEVALSEPFVTADKLLSPEEGLRNRFRKLLLIQTPTKTNVRAMLSLLARFGWLQTDEKEKTKFTLTPDGSKVISAAAQDPRVFRRRFAIELHKCYTVPGWFVHRLHELNSRGQGEVILPAPPRLPAVGRREWTDRSWPKHLDVVVVEAAKNANKVIPGAFPISADEWLRRVKAVWKRLGAGEPPVNRYATAEKSTFAVRERLFHAMREAAIDFLFGRVNPINGMPDFESVFSSPISFRAFSVWCPRLSETEFIFYTDYHPRIPGRLIVPCGAFRERSILPFEPLPGIIDPKGRTLCLYQPKWTAIKSEFLDVLVTVYREESRTLGAFYVSLLIVRDEVCRRLRLSAMLFDSLLAQAYEDTIRESTVNGKQFSISLESDIRPDQRSAIGLNQRPVYINRVPHSLIAIGTYRTPKL
jgi:hypothetical protein